MPHDTKSGAVFLAIGLVIAAVIALVATGMREVPSQAAALQTLASAYVPG